MHSADHPKESLIKLSYHTYVPWFLLHTAGAPIYKKEFNKILLKLWLATLSL